MPDNLREYNIIHSAHLQLKDRFCLQKQKTNSNSLPKMIFGNQTVSPLLNQDAE